jgi:hypothetical protein
MQRTGLFPLFSLLNGFRIVVVVAAAAAGVGNLAAGVDFAGSPLFPTNLLRLLGLVITVLGLELLNQLDIAALRLFGCHALVHDLLPFVVLVFALIEETGAHQDGTGTG